MAFISSRAIAGLVASTCASAWLVAGCGSPGHASTNNTTGGGGSAVTATGGAAGNSGAPGTGNAPAGGGTTGGGNTTGSSGTTGGGGGGSGNAGGSGAGGTDPATAMALFGDDSTNAPPPGEVCDRIATIQCAAEQLCCSNPGRNFTDCKSTMKKGCQDSHLDAITGDPQLSGYTTANATPIFQHYEALAKACDQTVTAWGGGLTGLRGLVPGTVNPGGDCTPEIGELQQSDVVAAHLSSCNGGSACLPHPPVPVKKWTCDAVVGVGGACFSDVNCTDGLYCVNPNLDLSGGTCAERKADTSACAAGNECASLLCKGGQCATIGVQSAYCLQN